MAQEIKDLELSLQCLELLLWLGFDLWPGNFLHAVGAAKKEKKLKRINMLLYILSSNLALSHEEQTKYSLVCI